jgi:hypothetical protein
MTRYYVSNARGDDSTGDGSAATPWKTMGHALQGSPPPFTPDPSNPNFLYVEPGVYRESLGVQVASSSGSPLSIVADCDGAGFAAGGYATPATGLVEWRAWSDDSTVIANVNLDVGSGIDYVTVAGFKIIGGSTTLAALNVAGLHFTLRDCIAVGYFGASSGAIVNTTASSGVATGLTIERCGFWTLDAGSPAVKIKADVYTTDWSMGANIVNCSFHGPGPCIAVTPSGGGSGSTYPGGLVIQNCTFHSTNYALYLHYGAVTLATPVTVDGCIFIMSGLYADSTGQIVEDGNVYASASINSGVTSGTHSVFSACPALDFGDDRLTGLPLRPALTPSPVSTFAGFGAYGTTPADDLTGRARPEGYGSTAPSAGCLERHDTGAKDVTHQDTGSSACLALVGPSSQGRLIIVDAAATVLTVKVRWDGNHGDTNKPQVVLVAEPQIGVAGQTKTATSTGGSGTTPNAYETLTFTSFTPTAKGAVMLRFVSRAAAGNGVAYFDSIGT